MSTTGDGDPAGPVDEEAENRRLSRSPAYWLRLMGVFWRISPARVTVLAVLTWGAAVIPGVQIRLTAMAVDAVADGIIGGDSDGAHQTLMTALVGITIAAVLAHLVGSYVQYLGGTVGLELTAKISEQVMAKGTRVDLATYEDPESYDRLQRAFQESTNGRAYEIFNGLIQTMKNLVTLLAISAALFSWHPWAALITLLSPLPAAAVHAFYGKREYEVEFGRAQDRRRAYYYQWLTTQDHTFKEIKLFGLGPHFIQRYQALIRGFYDVDRKLLIRQEGWSAAAGLIGVLGATAAMALAMLSAMDTSAVGELAGFLQAISAVSAASSALLVGVATLYQNTLFTGNLFDYLTLPESGIAGGSRPFPGRLTHGIEFQNVTFVYPGTTNRALDGFSCFLPAGQCCALVGQNGAGKTTLVKLLTRLYEPTSGRILLDGHPIEEYDLDELRRSIGVIFQDFIQYELPARDNIGFGRVEALHDDQRIAESAQASGAAAVIEKLDERYDTVLGRRFEDGAQLSGGQWQKVALARAFMRRAPILVLDEPTASIDAEAEAEVFGKLKEIAAGATSLVIAHRFSTVRIADMILVMENGRIKEQGTHSELIEQDGTYAYLFNLQASGYLPETAQDGQLQ
ncbi:ABC transporter ATP-binding protein [Streptomyces syringium]|uniref:ABC transporter ATP-binding protein n=1 Tax=Streptomyces syringium TaxID=76729 RepID=UPI0033EA9BC6